MSRLKILSIIAGIYVSAYLLFRILQIDYRLLVSDDFSRIAALDMGLILGSSLLFLYYAVLQIIRHLGIYPISRLFSYIFSLVVSVILMLVALYTLISGFAAHTTLNKINSFMIIICIAIIEIYWTLHRKREKVPQKL
ncbi:hypothetical protein [Salinimicrobium oceani]|uniref:Uncharacterized protein n=1 Tax=Salinimicrobium oceani TaxID=2722702 RepID=A0ABX1CVD8_9FLAO|nr:hypothetical protein [Salinimicrobium oceani]NJW51712.1 hypothetical protein [Salinimicrobium oceani]